MQGMKQDLAMAAGVLLMIGAMVLPLPSLVLDLLLAANLSLSLTIMLTAMYVRRPVDYTMFPSLLLLTTMLRLSLNVSSTRLILLHGHEGPAAAGRIIEGFGHFVVGGNYIVGIIVFIILIIINFMVITKGSGRIAEVAARFTLDAMPGKQMAIDADLNAGLLTEQAARKRRRAVEAEAGFYGAMDGASKFVRGDAIAGILITAINIVGGFLIGVAQQGMPASEAAAVYTILTVGDGLISQIPSLVISAAAGIVVTRAANTGEMGPSLVGQLLSARKTYYVLSVALAIFGLMPGMPLLIFWSMAAMAGFIAYYWERFEHLAAEAADSGDFDDEPGAEGAAGGGPADEAEDEQERLKRSLALNLLELHVGYALVPLVDESTGGDLLDRIGGLRRNLALEMGFILPAVHIRDDLNLTPGQYQVMLKGQPVARGEVMVGKVLAIDAGMGDSSLEGVPTHEPAFGLPALWINPEERDRAELLSYTVVEPSAVMVTHLSEVMRSHAYEMLGRQEVQELIDLLAETHAKVVEELVPQLLSVGEVVKVLRELLKEQISVRDMRTIMETLADHATASRDVATLTEHVRQSLSRSITRKYSDEQGVLHVLTLGQGAEMAFRSGRTPDGRSALDPSVANNLLSNLERAVSDQAQSGAMPVLLTPPDLRRQLRTFTERFLPQLSVLSYKEVDTAAEIRAMGAVNI